MLDAEAVDVGDELAVDAKALARERDQQHAALHHAGGADLARGRAAGDGDAGEGLAERRGEHFGVVVDAEEGDDVLEVAAVDLGPDLGDGLARGRRALPATRMPQLLSLECEATRVSSAPWAFCP